MAADPKRQERSAVPVSATTPSTGPRRGSREEALKIILENRLSDGLLTGALGVPQVGKTYHVAELADAAVAADIAGLVLIHDCKRREPQYPGAVRHSIADLMARPLGPEDPATVVFHQDAAGAVPDCDAIADAAFRLAAGGERPLVLLDEAYKALKPGGGRTWSGPNCGKLFREGSSQGISTIWTTQIIQGMPTELKDLTESVALFRLASVSLAYVVENWRLPAEAEALLPRLGRGEFLLITQANGWDGVVYGPD